jgi:putative membrane-bound dehydrogenase-like protein
MPKSRLFRSTGALTLLVLLGDCVAAQPQPTDDFQQPEFPARPAPPWVQPFDLGDSDPRLKGWRAPRGIKVEIVAAEPVVVNPRHLAFAEDGTLYVLESSSRENLRMEQEEVEGPSGRRIKRFRTRNDARDELKSLHDTTGDGIYDQVRVVMDDLELPGGLLIESGWIYWTSAGRVLRRRPHAPDVLEQLQAAAAAKRGPPATTTADGKWIEQELVAGLSAVEPFHASGLTLGADGWLYVTAGSGDNRPESWDGSRAVVLRTGGVFRMGPDGSQVHEYARGLLNPRGSIASDELGNLFHLDDDLEGGGKFAGVRLLHLLEGGDYGWRHRELPPDDDFDPRMLLQPDLARAAAWGERPGKLPGVFKTGAGSPAGLLICTSSHFPPDFRGLVIYPEPVRKSVRAYAIERERQSFKVAAQFDLLKSDDPLFAPCHAIQGPDGAIYVADRRGSEGDAVAKQGRIYRLSWSGTADMPAIELESLDAWKQIADGTDDQLAALISHDDFELRRRAAGELVRRARLDQRAAPAIAARLTTIAYDDSRLPPVRFVALAAVAQIMDATAFEALVLMLGHSDPDIQRLSADALGSQPPRDDDQRSRLIQALHNELFAPQPGVPRSMLLAHGKVAEKLETAEWAYEGASVTIRKEMGPEIFDAHVRALEMTKDAARDLLIGNLEVAITFEDADPKERQRIKEFVVATAEAMRTRELAVFLDALLRGDANFLGKLDPPLAARLIATYRNVQVEPPITTDALAKWLNRQPTVPVEVELTALETMSLVDTAKADAVTKLAERLLAQPEHAKEIARRFIAGQMGEGLRDQIAAVLRKHGEQDRTGAFTKLLTEVVNAPPFSVPSPPPQP